MADSPCISRMRTFTEIVTGDLNSFADDLRQWWFTKYSRSGGVLDSSGFEHVFQVCHWFFYSEPRQLGMG